jgi:hypothetical protein
MGKATVKKTIRRKRKQSVKVTQGDLLAMADAYGMVQGMKLVDQVCKLMFTESVPLAKLVRAGNIKIPKETAIFNMSSATDCASLALGKCKACVFDPELEKLRTVCYALKAERAYRPAVLPYRRRQELFWKDITANSFALQFLCINSTKRLKFDKVRFNEAGDFHTQACVDKADAIAKILLKFGVTCYCYTSRDDLDYTKVKSLVINASGFEADGLVNDFMMLEKGKTPPKGYAKCPMDCTLCDRCSKRGKKTYVPQH